MDRFFFATLGCKVNQYESRSLREAWTAMGLEESPRPDGASHILVNSCAVTAKAVADTRATVRRLHRAAPHAAIWVSGCAAEVLAKELADLPGVAGVIPQSGKDGLLRALPWRAPGGQDTPAASAYPGFAVSGYDRSRAVLKIQDGCSHGCAYCIVPLTRGRARSRPAQEAVAEAERLLRAGFREIVISGVNLRQFRLYAPGREQPALPDGREACGHKKDAGDGDFWDFLALLDARLAPVWAGQARFRISSLEPGQLGQKALDTLARCRMTAPHLHLSLQSGSPPVLRRMGRAHYDPGALPAFLAGLRGIWPLYALGADILTGFPGESEEEFAEGFALCRELPLTYAHVFPYSRRPGTRAAALPDQVPADVKKNRAAALRALVEEKRADFLTRLAQLPALHVAFESERAEGKARRAAPRGVCEYYADCLLAEHSAPPPPGALSRVRPLAAQNNTLLVEAL